MSIFFPPRPDYVPSIQDFLGKHQFNYYHLLSIYYRLFVTYIQPIFSVFYPIFTAIQKCAEKEKEQGENLVPLTVLYSIRDDENNVCDEDRILKYSPNQLSILHYHHNHQYTP